MLPKEAHRKWKQKKQKTKNKQTNTHSVFFNLNYFLFFWIKWTTRFYNCWASTPKKLLMSFITTSFLSSCFCGFFPLESFFRPLPLEVSQQRNQQNRHLGVPWRNFLPAQYTVVLTFYFKSLNSSCIHRWSLEFQGQTAREEIYGNKSFLELQSILHQDPLRTLWFSKLPLVNEQPFSLLYRMFLLKICQKHYPFHVTSSFRFSSGSQYLR